MTAVHRAPEEWMLDYAVGGLCEASTLAIEVHLALAPGSRRELRLYEEIGGAMLDSCATSAVNDDCFDKLMARLDAPEEAGGTAEGSRDVHVVADCAVPAPLQRYIGTDYEALPWKRVIKGLREAVIDVDGTDRVKLLRVDPGAAMPRHTHGGQELTVILKGGFVDGGVTYHAGDVAIADEGVDHAPTALPDEECICLAVTQAPLKLTGFFGRFFNAFLKD